MKGFTDGKELTEIKGAEIITDLLWHLLVERPMKLKDCKGREDDTWKYAIYETFGGKSFAVASSHNRPLRDMVRLYEKDYWESRGHNRRMAEREAATV